ncbi:hypothetical protein ACJX0J_033827, partial [Zea mays]
LTEGILYLLYIWLKISFIFWKHDVFHHIKVRHEFDDNAADLLHLYLSGIFIDMF